MKTLHIVAFTLVIVGALNWGLAVFGYNLVELIFGAASTLTNLVYLLVAASGVYLIFTHMQECKVCASKK